MKPDKVSLAISHPEIASEACDWNPAEFTQGSNKKLKWRCKNNHIYESRIFQRTQRGQGCPFCAGQKVSPGLNDLKTVNPELAKQLYKLDPSQIMANSNKNVEWICDLGHVWTAKPNNRSSGKSGCPYCKNSKVLAGFNDFATTHPDLAKFADGWDPKTITFGSGLKRNWRCPKGHKFKTTVQTLARTNNSGCPVCTNKLVIRGVNDLATTHPDIAKEAHGWNPEEIVAGNESKFLWKCSKGHIWETSPTQRANNNSNCHFCSNQKVLAGFNDLATTHPDIAKEAHGWNPKTITFGSNQFRDWVCSNGHVYRAKVQSRTGKLSGCHFCSNKKLLKGFNDLLTVHPQISEEADGWDPGSVLTGTHKKLQWKCSEGHIWTALVSTRIRGSGCPSCAKFGFDPNREGYLYLLEHPAWELLQVGITNFPKNRIKDHKRIGWEVLDIRGPMDGFITQELEKSILKMLKSIQVELGNVQNAGKYSGFTEAWSKNKFNVHSLSQLIMILNEWETNQS
jgi:hypothetical protein